MLTSCFCTHNYTYKDALRQHPLGDMGTVCKSTQKWKVLYAGVFQRYSSLTPIGCRQRLDLLLPESVDLLVELGELCAKGSVDLCGRDGHTVAPREFL